MKFKVTAFSTTDLAEVTEQPLEKLGLGVHTHYPSTWQNEAQDCGAFQNRKEEERTLIYLNEDSSVSSAISVISKFVKLSLFHNTEERVFILKEVGEV